MTDIHHSADTPRVIYVSGTAPGTEGSGSAPTMGSAANALLLYTDLQNVQQHLRGQEQVLAMKDLAERQKEHLDCVAGLDHQAHALAVTPAIRIGHLELGPLVMGSVLTVAAALIMLALKISILEMLLVAALFWLVATGLLNAAIRGARKNAVRFLSQQASDIDAQEQP